MNFMLDIDTCIYLINRHPKMQRNAPFTACAISVVVLGELQRAILKSSRPAPTMTFVEHMNVIDIDAEVARTYAEIRVHLESSGQPIGPNDSWIAAHARTLKLPLITNNTREFSRVPNLTVDTWMMK